ncbi:MAG: protein-disulfide reductase DsbD [Aeromonas sp.]
MSALLCGAPVAATDLLTSLGLSSAPRFLPVDEAFSLSAEQQGRTLTLRVAIADSYYLYQHSIKVAGQNVQFTPPILPQGQAHHDDFFGQTQVYYHALELPLALHSAEAGAHITLAYQGCTDGLCYPPLSKTIEVPALAPAPLATLPADSAAKADLAKPQTPALSEQDALAAALGAQSFWVSLGAFFLLGLGLAFTPCVFPMYPILTGIIAGAGQLLSTARAGLLSLVYVQGMALTYTALGLVVASLGMQFQAALQHPLVLIGLSGLFVLLALSMFGVFNLQLPSRLQTKLAGLANQQQGGSVAGVAIMGMISGLVCSPCTTAPLSGALIYVAQSGDLLLGGAALYALSLGMGVPLLLLGVSGGKLLPKAGAWMNVVKQLFGFALLAVPVLLLSRLWSDTTSVLAWLGWGLGVCAYLYHHNQRRPHSWRKSARGFALLLAMLSAVVWAKALLLPAPATETAKAEVRARFTQIKTYQDLQQQLALARAANKPLLLDLYADWCVACKEFEHQTFTDAKVQAQFANVHLVQADVTANDAEDIALLRALNVLGLPTLILFDRQGQELVGQRVTGFMPADEFSRVLEQLW